MLTCLETVRRLVITLICLTRHVTPRSDHVTYRIHRVSEVVLMRLVLVMRLVVPQVVLPQEMLPQMVVLGSHVILVVLTSHVIVVMRLI